MNYLYPLIMLLTAVLPITHPKLLGVPLSNKAGKTIEVEILKIEPETEQQSDYSTINDLLSIPLFQDNNLLDDTIESVAERLNWALESKTDHQSSYRQYPVENYRYT